MAGSSTSKRTPNTNGSPPKRRSAGAGTTAVKRSVLCSGEVLPSRRSTVGFGVERPSSQRPGDDSTDDGEPPSGGPVTGGRDSGGVVETSEHAPDNNGSYPNRRLDDGGGSAAAAERLASGSGEPPLTHHSTGDDGGEGPSSQRPGDDNSDSGESPSGSDVTRGHESGDVEPQPGGAASGNDDSAVASNHRPGDVGSGSRSTYESPLKRVRRAINGTNKRVIDTAGDLKDFIEHADPQGRGIPTSVAATIALRMRLVWTSFDKCSTGVVVARLHLVDNLVRESVPEMHKVFKDAYPDNKSIVDSELVTASLYGVDESTADLPGDGAVLLVSRMWSLKLFAKQSCQLSTSLSSITVEAYTH